MKMMMWATCISVCVLIPLGGVLYAQGASGATLQASKTLDICTQKDGLWRYFGEVSVWNTGTADAQGLSITDCLQYKSATDKKQPSDLVCLENIQGLVTMIPGLTQETEAIRFAYSFASAYSAPLDLSGTIRNSAQLTITNHSGGVVKGPNPKYTWAGGTPPACRDDTNGDCGCTYTQGYWGNKPNIQWPDGFDRGALFFNSGLSWQQIMDASVAGGNAYIQLAHQYIAAKLNVANNACHASSVDGYITLAEGYFSGQPADSSFCKANVCGLQVTWAGILADYNQGTGVYEGNPGHCGDDDYVNSGQ